MSILFIELKYARMVGPRLLLWRVKKDSPFHGNARCPVCGDSAQSKTKTRFHITEHDGMVFCSCFNCDYKNSLVNFLKAYHPDLHSEFVFEKYRVTGDSAPLIIGSKEPVKEAFKPAESALKRLALPRVSDLPETHACAEYVKSRQLPTYEFYYAEKFLAFSKQYNPDVGESTDGPRLVIPFFDKQGNIYAYQGRDLTGKSSLKYITITVDKRVPKVFGLNRIDKNSELLIVEGPIDSLFLPNCIASVNASLISTARKISPLINKSQVTLIYDNEGRNKIIVDHYKEAVSLGYKIVIWPPSVGAYKDINDMVKANIDVLKVIKNNTFSGLIAQIELNKWKKV